MAVFTYAARDEAGMLVEGELTALDEAEAVRSIRNEGRFVVRVEPKGRAPAKKKPNAKVQTQNVFGDKFRPDDLIFFTNQLAMMIDTGVSLADALDACVHDGNSPRFAKALDAVITQVRAGMEFSAALAEHPKVFPRLFISLIKASEASGQLAPILTRLASHLERQRDMKRKIKGAVTYPIVMSVFAIGVTIFLVSFVLPKFAAIYAGREASLPWMTKALLDLSDIVVDYGLYALGAVVLTSGGLFAYFRTAEGRWKAEKIKLSLPMVGTLYHKNYQARSLRTLGTMIQAGVSMLDSVQLTKDVCGSLRYERMWSTVNERIERGQQVSEALADQEDIPKSVLKMLNAGERSGQLGPVMERVSAFCETELNAALKALTNMIEPAIVTFLGIVVGGLVMALLLPIFTISRAL